MRPRCHTLLQAVDLALVDSLVVPASLHDVDGRFVHMNEAAEQASGLSRAQLLGRHFTEPESPEARESVAEQFRRAVECGEPTDFETVFIDGSGQLRACGRSICRSARATRSSALSFSRSLRDGQRPNFPPSSRIRD
jgi:PAS domain S-box-containing protein